MAKTVRTAWGWNGSAFTLVPDTPDGKVARGAESRYYRLGRDYSEAEMMRRRRKAREAARKAIAEQMEG